MKETKKTIIHPNDPEYAETLGYIFVSGATIPEQVLKELAKKAGKNNNNSTNGSEVKNNG